MVYQPGMANDLTRFLDTEVNRRAGGDEAERARLIARLAEAAGIEPGTVNQILNGSIDRPPDDRLRGFARVLDVTFERLVGMLPSALQQAAADARPLALNAAGEAPAEIQILTAGQLKTRDGRGPYHLADAAAVIAETQALGMDLPIDFDHALDLAPAGTAKPAAGWITRLEARPDGIYGQVEWTERGRAAVAGREYRYISPVFRHDTSGRVLRLDRAALTNDPNLFLKALNNREKETHPVDELMKQLRAALGLDGKADVVAAVTALHARAKLLADVAKALGVDENAPAADFAKALAARQAEPDPAQYVPAEAVKALQTQLADLTAKQAQQDAEAAVAAAMRDGRLTPALKDWGLALHAKSPQAFADYVAAAPRVIDTAPAARPARDVPETLSAADKAICAALGLPEDKFIATRKQEAV